MRAIRMKTILRQSVFAAAYGLTAVVNAATVDIADKPMTSAAKLIKPNVMFLLDASGSMASDYMPDDAPHTVATYGYRASQCNGVAYNPAIKYDPPLRSDSSSLPNSSFTAAWSDGYVVENLTQINSTSSVAVANGSKTFTISSTSGFSTTGTVQIVSSANRNVWMMGTVTSWSSSTKKLVVNVTSFSGSGTYSSWTIVNPDDLSALAQYYYTYSGVQPAMSYSYSSAGALNTGVIFYKECNSSVGSSPGLGVFTKVTVTSSSADAQNYANWYSYYRTRMNTMKTSMTQAFGKLASPENFRIGFSTIAYSGTDSTDDHFLEIKDYCSATTNCQQRQDFFQKIFRSSSTSWTPLRNALSKAGLIYAGKLLTGTRDPVQYYCQKHWAILSTDGYWNTGGGSGNGTDYDNWKDAGGFTIAQAGSYPSAGSGVGKQDGPTNTDYVDTSGIATTMKRPMLDQSDYSNTLADVAMYYYKTDLRDSGLGNCTSGSTGKDTCTDKVPLMTDDCNPRQHMNTITFGLGVNGTLSADDYPAAANSTSDYYKLKNGPTNWPNPSSSDSRTIDDLWHAAINGRGTYFHPNDPSAIANDLSKALAKVASSVGGGSGAGVSALQLSASSPNYVFLSNYNDGVWDGDLQAYTISATGLLSGSGSSTGTCKSSSSGGGVTWSARDELQLRNLSSDPRVIYTSKGGWGAFDTSNSALTTTDFDASKLSQWGSFTATEKSYATRDNLIMYLRGVDHSELPPAGSGKYCCENQSNNAYRLFRDRDYRLGDIVHSTPYYVGTSPFQYTDSNHKAFKNSYTDVAAGKRNPTVFVGANDGMLHAFDANSGKEKWAFVPSAVVPSLYKLADFSYNSNHQFFVDGQMNVGDVCPSAPSSACTAAQWKTILVGGLGEGGRDYFALDITNPDSPSLLWEFAAKNPTDASKLGKSFGTPLIVKIKGGTQAGKWVVVFSSGYNNTDEGTHLFVVNAWTGQLISDITGFSGMETSADKSGMGSVAGWTDQGIANNEVQHVYGGDLNGNVWRFDISSGSSGDVVKLATLADPAGVRQPITTKPELGEVISGPSKTRIVFAGTGKWMGFYADVPTTTGSAPPAPPAPISPLWSAKQTQSLYAIKDDLSHTFGNFRSSGAAQMTITGGTTSRSVSYPSAASTQGWFVDFPGAGERVTIDPELQIGWLSVTTNVPSASDDCVTGGDSFHYFFDYNPTVARTTTASWEASYLGSALAAGSGTVQTPSGSTGVVVSDASGKMQFVSNQAPGPKTTVRRVSWRELKH